MVVFNAPLLSSLILSTLLTRAVSVLGVRQPLSTLNVTEISSFKPFTFYASTGYCQPSRTLTWSCGTNCDANPTFRPVASGGDGAIAQYWFVGVDPKLQTVVVGHQGTDTHKLIPLITDANFFLDKLDPTLFPGLDPNIEVHDGFAEAHAKTATSVLSAVRTALRDSNFNHVTTVGHSLGGALALLDGIYLSLHLPQGISFRTIGYGLPRVGNQAFADYVDYHVALTHVNNKKDPIPTLPGRFLGFHHPQGEIHIQDDGSWVVCPGQDNVDSRCTTGTVSIVNGNVGDHDGPYDSVTIDC